MSEVFGSAYTKEKSIQYDEQSRFDKGDREMHKLYLSETLNYLDIDVKRSIDIGCGTGFYTETIASRYPESEITMIDSSHHMLAIAQNKLEGKAFNIRAECNYIENYDWQSLEQSQLIFSSLTVHFLHDEDKWKMFSNVYNNLEPGGVFILFGQFDPDEQQWSGLLEHLSCIDLKRRIEKDLDITFELDELKIENLKIKARKIKKDDMEKDCSLDKYVEELKKAGFKSTCTIFQESRFFGLVTKK